MPGLGQYLQGAPRAGLVYTGAAITGILLAQTGDADAAVLPRRGSDQLAFEGVHLVATAGGLSAWDAFHRAVPALQREGKYEFLGEREHVGALLAAPFDLRFLGRWTTWVELGVTGAVTAWVLSSGESAATYPPFKANDAAFVGSLSFNAAVGEEAMFRGWLLPLLHGRLGHRFGVANALQALIFGAAHLPQAEHFAAVIAASAAFSGWVTRRNGWSVREPIFHHFWYDVVVATATFLRDDRVPVQLPAIRIRF